MSAGAAGAHPARSRLASRFDSGGCFGLVGMPSSGAGNAATEVPVMSPEALERVVSSRIQTRNEAHDVDDGLNLPSETVFLLNKPKAALKAPGSPIKRRQTASVLLNAGAGSPNRFVGRRQGSLRDVAAGAWGGAAGAADGSRSDTAGRHASRTTLIGTAPDATSRGRAGAAVDAMRGPLEVQPPARSAAGIRPRAVRIPAEPRSSRALFERTRPGSVQPVGARCAGDCALAPQPTSGCRQCEAMADASMRSCSSAAPSASASCAPRDVSAMPSHAVRARASSIVGHLPGADERAPAVALVGATGRTGRSFTRAQCAPRASAGETIGTRVLSSMLRTRPLRRVHDAGDGSSDERISADIASAREGTGADEPGRSRTGAPAAACAERGLAGSARPSRAADTTATGGEAHERQARALRRTMLGARSARGGTRTSARSDGAKDGVDDGADSDADADGEVDASRSPWYLRFTIHPHSVANRRWQRLVLVAAIIIAFEAPYTAAYLLETPRATVALGVVLDAVLLADIAVKAFTGFVSEDANAVVLDVRQIGRAYALSWLALDLVAGVPWQLVALALDAAHGVEYAAFVRIARISRCAKVPVALVARRRAEPSNGALVVTLVTCYFLALHWLTALQWGLQRALGFPAEAWVRTTRVLERDVVGRWLFTAFNTISQMATVDYGNYDPTTRQELLTSVGNTILGALAFGLLVSAMSLVLASTDASRVRFVEEAEATEQFLSVCAMPIELRTRVRAHLHANFPTGRYFDETQVLEMLPHSLQRDLRLVRARTLYQKVPLFRAAGMTFMMQIAQHLTPYNALPGEYLVHEGEKLTRVVFIDEGVVHVLAGRAMKLVAELSGGAFIGEVSALLDSFAVATVRVVEDAQLFSIGAAQFRELLASFPAVRDAIVLIIHVRLGALSLGNEGGRAPRVEPGRDALPAQADGAAQLEADEESVAFGPAGGEHIDVASSSSGERDAARRATGYARGDAAALSSTEAADGVAGSSARGAALSARAAERWSVRDVSTDDQARRARACTRRRAARCTGPRARGYSAAAAALAPRRCVSPSVAPARHSFATVFPILGSLFLRVSADGV